jgi:hypothetical protein
VQLHQIVAMAQLNEFDSARFDEISRIEITEG